MIERKIQRCPYKNNGCERKDINNFVLIHMCESNSYHNCYEYLRIKKEPKVYKPTKLLSYYETN